MSKKKNKQKNNRTAGANKQKLAQKQKEDVKIAIKEQMEIDNTPNKEKDILTDGPTPGHAFVRVFSKLSEKVAPKLGLTKTSLFNFISGLAGVGLGHIAMHTGEPFEGPIQEILKIGMYMMYSFFIFGIFIIQK